MDEPIEDLYFNWLYTKVVTVSFPTPTLSYLTLMRDLHSTEFVWLIPGDDNRVEDGLELRKEFINQALIYETPAWKNIPCSVLEMLIAFSRRTSFDTDFTSKEWFWMFLENLNLAEFNDSYLQFEPGPSISQTVSYILDTFIWRTYEPSGFGGLFPLESYKNDQRKVEIFYQWCEWVFQNDLL